MKNSMHYTFRSALRCLLTLGFFSAAMISAEAAPKANKKNKGKKGSLAQLEKEVRTVTLKKRGSKNSPAVQTKKKVHALFTTATMDAFVDTEGLLYVQPKAESSSDEVNGTLVLSPLMRYKDEANGHARTKNRRILSASTASAPARNPRTLTVNMEVSDGVQATVVYTFDGKEVTVELEIKDSSKTEAPTTSYLTLAVPQAFDLPIDATMQRKVSISKDCKLKVGSKSYAYAEPTKGSGRGGLERKASIAGQWPGCSIVLEAKPGLHLYTYPGSLLFEGYSIFANEKDKGGNATKTMSISVVPGS